MDIWAPPTWAVIHSYTTTYNPNFQKSEGSVALKRLETLYSSIPKDPAGKLKRFIKLVTLLLCCKECRNNAIGELENIPIGKYLKNKDTLFLWSWTLHDSVNVRLGKNRRNYKEAKDWYFSRIGMFGSCIWRVMHAFAVVYTPDKSEEFKEFVMLLIELSCCEEWKELGREALLMCPIGKYLESNEALFNWTYRLHDHINKKLKRTSTDYKKTKDWYFTRLGGDDYPFVQGSTKGKCKSCAV